MKRIPLLITVVVGAVVVGLAAANLNPLRGIIDDILHRETTTASGDVVLKRLRETKTLEASEGSFEVPVVVCNSGAKAYEDKADINALLNSCDGWRDEKATVLVEADVKAVIDLDGLDSADVDASGKAVRLTLPEPTLSDPEVDAATGTNIVARDSSMFPGTDLPADYLARAAVQGKSAIASVAERSELREKARTSARTLFEGLLAPLGFTEVTIEFRPAPAP